MFKKPLSPSSKPILPCSVSVWPSVKERSPPSVKAKLPSLPSDTDSSCGTPSISVTLAPYIAATEPPLLALLSTILITPAIASEPYWAAAPSRNTSMRSIAFAGIAFKSTDDEPRPVEPFKLSNALLWRRLPLTSTKV